MPNDILRREAFRLRNLSETCAQGRDFQTAYQLLKIVVDIEEPDTSFEQEELAADFHRLGSICIMMNSWLEAQTYLQKALDLRMSSGKHDSESMQETKDLLKRATGETSVPKQISGTSFEAQR